MAGAKITSSMKEAGLSLTRIPKLLAPYLLFAVTGFLHNGVKYVYMNPLTSEMSGHLHEMEEDHSSGEYAGLVHQGKQDATSLLVISIAISLLTLTIAFAKQIAAASTATSSGKNSGVDRFSLAELLREATTWRNMKYPLVATAAVVAMWQLLLGPVFSSSSVQGFLFLVVVLAVFYFGMLVVSSVGSSRKEFSVMVLATLLLPTLVIPVCALVLLHLYTKQVMGLGTSLLSVYDLMQGVQDLLYLSAAGVYCSSCYQPAEATRESEEMVVAKPRYFSYAILFVLFVIPCAAVYYKNSQMLA